MKPDAALSPGTSWAPQTEDAQALPSGRRMSEAANPRHLLQQAQSLLGEMEYMISGARGATEDDKLSVETRLVMVAVRLFEIEHKWDAIGAALVATSAAMRQAETA
jgi:hypothetical protein